jgi:hypothetical protein
VNSRLIASLGGRLIVEMKTKKMWLKRFALVALGLLCQALILHAQDAPTITTQPASMTAFPGTSVTFSVAVDGTGPFSYQWMFNGSNLPNNIITTVTGNGATLYEEDGEQAVNSSLDHAEGVILDFVGNLYIADTYQNRVRKVGTNGFMTTVAGNGSVFYSGDGGAAISADVGYPASVAFDAPGNMYIVEENTARVRKV